MKIWSLFFILFSLAFASPAFGQEVEHNYLVGPQKTSCDSLNLRGMDKKEQISTIRNTTFRLSQDIALNRKTGFQGAWYFACDNESGYMVVKIDNKESLYTDISKSTWQAFIRSGDFESFLRDNLDPVD